MACGEEVENGPLSLSLSPEAVVQLRRTFTLTRAGGSGRRAGEGTMRALSEPLARLSQRESKDKRKPQNDLKAARPQTEKRRWGRAFRRRRLWVFGWVAWEARGVAIAVDQLRQSTGRSWG